MYAILNLDNEVWRAAMTTCNMREHDEDEFLGLGDNSWVRCWPDKGQAVAFAERKNMRNFRVVPLYIAEKLNGEVTSCFA